MKHENKPAWMTGDWDEAMLAVDAETDPVILAEIADKAPLRDVREVAVDLLEDVSLLRQIAEKNSDSAVRLCAFRKVYQAGCLQSDTQSIVAGILNSASIKDLKSLLPELADFLPEDILAESDIKIVRSEPQISGHEPRYHQEIVYKGKLIVSDIV